MGIARTLPRSPTLYGPMTMRKPSVNPIVIPLAAPGDRQAP